MIIGTDAFSKINNWYKAEELKKIVHFIVFPRKGSIESFPYERLKKEGWDFELTSMDCVDISSTEIRNNKTKNTNEVLKEYIENNGLY